MTKLETWTDAAIGETRQALVRDGKPIMLHVSRWSDAGRRAQWGEAYTARVRNVDTRRRGAFLDMGLGEHFGFARIDAAGRARLRSGPVALVEGQAVTANVSREGARGKGPVMEIVSLLPETDTLGRTARHESSENADAAGPADADTREKLDALVDAGLSPTAPIPGGGVLTIEPTSALVAIDVDSAARRGPSDPERFARDLNLAAAEEAARQLRLRGLGGLVAIDFVSMRDRRAQEAVTAAVKAATADDPWGVTVAAMSRFGVVELSRGQLRAPLHELLCDAHGQPTAETVALAALRGIEREARTAKGRVVVAWLGDEVLDWLLGEHISWRVALNGRIGPRWDIRRKAGAPRAQWDVEVE